MSIILKVSQLSSDISEVASARSTAVTAMDSAESSKQSELSGLLAAQTLADVAELNVLRGALNSKSGEVDSQTDLRASHIGSLVTAFDSAADAVLSDMHGLMDGSGAEALNFTTGKLILRNETTDGVASLTVASGSDGFELQFDDDSANLVSSGKSTQVGGIDFDGSIGVSAGAVYTHSDLAEFSE